MINNEYRVYSNRTQAKKMISNLYCAQLDKTIPESEFSCVNSMLCCNRINSTALSDDK